MSILKVAQALAGVFCGQAGQSKESQAKACATKKTEGEFRMSKMTVMAFQLEGDEAAISSGCEMIVRAIRQITGVASPELVGQASVLANNARASALAPPSTSAGLKSQVAPALAGGLPGTEHRLKPVPLNQHPHPSLSRKGAGEGQSQSG